MSPYQPDVEIDYCCDFGIPVVHVQEIEHISLKPGDVLVFRLPNRFGDDLLRLVKDCALAVAEANPSIVTLILPEEVGLAAVTAPVESSE